MEKMSDLIERQKAIDGDALITDIKECIEVQEGNYEFDKSEGLKVALECIADQPTIEPKREMGHWVRWYEIKEDKNGIEYIPRCTCSECITVYDLHNTRNMRFCTFCVANMIGEGR